MYLFIISIDDVYPKRSGIFYSFTKQIYMRTKHLDRSFVNGPVYLKRLLRLMVKLITSLGRFTEFLHYIL